MHPRLIEIQNRLAEIRGLLDTPDADIDALDAEVRSLQAEKATVEAAVEKRRALELAVADGDAPVVRTFLTPSARTNQPDTFDAASPEYRSAFLKNLAHINGQWRLGEMTDVEKRAFTYLTSTTDAVLPTGIQLGIVDMIRKDYALLGDLSITNFTGAVEFQQATTIVSGEAAETNENTANADNLQVTFVKKSMTGVEFRGSVKIGNKMRLQSIPEFESWLTNELSRELGEQMNDHAYDAIDDDIAEANEFTPADLDADDIKGAFAVLKGGRGTRYCYANNSTIWNHLAGVVDLNGNEKFIESSVTDDPAVQGRVYGTQVKLDETLADNVIYIGYPAQIKANMFEAPNVLSDMDVETRETVFGGYSLFEAKLGDTRAWAKITVTPVS